MLLVVGDSRRTINVVAALRAAGATRIQHCAEATSALQLVESADDPVEWVLIDGRMPPADNLLLLRALSGREPPPGVSLMWHRDAGYTSEELRPLLCAIESGNEGHQILRCALRQARHDPSTHPLLAHIVEETPLAFGYIAPTRRSA